MARGDGTTVDAFFSPSEIEVLISLLGEPIADEGDAAHEVAIRIERKLKSILRASRQPGNNQGLALVKTRVERGNSK